MFICGSRSFSHHRKDENYNSQYCTLKRSKRSKSLSNSSKINPYSNQGLDKFSALLSDLDEKKQQIYMQMGSEEISFVQFVYSSDSKHLKPIVVKVRNSKNNHGFLKRTPSNMSNTVTPNPADAADKSFDAVERDREMVTVVSQEQKSTRWKTSFRRDDLRRPNSYCFFAILVLILLFLAIYGRSFAIFCTTMSWYLIPNIVGGSSSSSNGNKRLIFRP
ncbi:hypothetical protein ABFX02_14G265800 [Erythranthe guttata]